MRTLSVVNSTLRCPARMGPKERKCTQEQGRAWNGRPQQAGQGPRKGDAGLPREDDQGKNQVADLPKRRQRGGNGPCPWSSTSQAGPVGGERTGTGKRSEPCNVDEYERPGHGNGEPPVPWGVKEPSRGEEKHC
jgi:hypothetical protein